MVASSTVQSQPVISQPQALELSAEAWSEIQAKSSVDFRAMGDFLNEIAERLFEAGFLLGVEEFDPTTPRPSDRELRSIAAQRWNATRTNYDLNFDGLDSRVTQLSEACFTRGYSAAQERIAFQITFSRLFG